MLNVSNVCRLNSGSQEVNTGLSNYDLVPNPSRYKGRYEKNGKNRLRKVEATKQTSFFFRCGRFPDIHERNIVLRVSLCTIWGDRISRGIYANESLTGEDEYSFPICEKSKIRTCSDYIERDITEAFTDSEILFSFSKRASMERAPLRLRVELWETDLVNPEDRVAHILSESFIVYDNVHESDEAASMECPSICTFKWVLGNDLSFDANPKKLPSMNVTNFLKKSPNSQNPQNSQDIFSSYQTGPLGSTRPSCPHPPTHPSYPPSSDSSHGSGSGSGCIPSPNLPTSGGPSTDLETSTDAPAKKRKRFMR